jgi:dTDP-4-dehydrorhamnose reductase
VVDTLRRIRPNVVIHTAKGRDHDDWRATADGAAHVAVASAAAEARLVHVSSDAVFSGQQVHYNEDALPDPVNQYGAAKAAAETAVRAIAPDAAVVRTSIILGDGHGAHERLTRDLASGRLSGALFTDEIRMPVHLDDLADALVELAGNRYYGVLNVAGPEAMSRYELGLLVAERDGLDPACLPAARSESLRAARPLDVRLVSDRAQSVLRTRLRGAREFMTAAGAGARGTADA